MTEVFDVDQGLVDSFFAVQTGSDLSTLIERARASGTFGQSLAHSLTRWKERHPAEPNDYINTKAILSPDLTAVIYGLCPIIFMGTNLWGAKRWADVDYLQQKAQVFGGRAQTLIGESQAKKCFVVVPEKDIVIDKLRGESASLVRLDQAVTGLAERLSGYGVPMVYDGFMQLLPRWASEDEYVYPDSHLLTRDYWLIFCEVMQHLGFAEMRNQRLTLRSDVDFGDLNTKFEQPLHATQTFLFPHIAEGGAAAVVDGHQTFASPLGDTVQKIRNPKAPIHASIEIWGDSHCSILASRKMSYMFASSFQSTIFRWDPWGVRGQRLETEADFVVMEISQRFIF